MKQSLSLLMSVLLAGLPIQVAYADEHDQAIYQEIEQLDMHDLYDLVVDFAPDLEVATPARIRQYSSLAPANVTVISKQDIEYFGYQTIAELLRHVAGFSATSDLTHANFGVRGIHPGARAGSRVIKFMIDGRPASFRASTQNLIDESYIPMSLIERVEIVKGPVSALYGANAFLGVVNIITRDSQDFRAKGNLLDVQARASESGDAGGQISLAGGQLFNVWEWTYGISAGVFNRDSLALPPSSPNYDDHLQNPQELELSADRDRSEPLVIYTKARRTISAEEALNMSLHLQKFESDQPYADLLPLRASGYNHNVIYNGFLQLDYENQFLPDWLTRVNLAYSQGRTGSDDRVASGNPEFYFLRDWGYSAIDFNADVTWRPSQRRSLLVGLDVSREMQDIETLKRVDAMTGVSTRVSPVQRVDQSNHGVYVQWTEQWREQLHTTLGYRLSQHDHYTQQHSWRAALVVPFSPRYTLKLLYGTAFQAPSPELLFRSAFQSGDIRGNPALEPQVAESWELVFTGELSQHTTFGATFFYTTVDDLVRYHDELDNLTARNSATARVSGVEFELAFQNEYWFVYGNASWQHSRTQSGRLSPFDLSESELFPEWMWNAGIHYRPPGSDWGIGFDNNYNHTRRASETNIQAAESVYHLGRYWDAALNVYRDIDFRASRDVRLQLQIKDAWNEAYAQPGFGGIDVPSQGRRYSLSLQLRY